MVEEKDEDTDDEAVAAFTTPLVMISLILFTAPKSADEIISRWQQQPKKIIIIFTHDDYTDGPQAPASVPERADTEADP